MIFSDSKIQTPEDELQKEPSDDIALTQQKPSQEQMDYFKDLKMHSKVSDPKAEALETELKRNKKNFCHQCKKSFAGNLKRHIDSVHEGLKKHKCESCQLAYSDKRSLQNHNFKKHQASF